MFKKKINQLNLFILEGIDGAGKTSTIQLIKEIIHKKKLKDFLFLKEPTDLDSGQKIRTLLAENKNLTTKEWLELFREDRMNNFTKNILPNSHKIIVMDRYFFSTVAYQSEYTEDIKKIYKFFVKDFPLPSKIFYFLISPEEAIKRVQNRNPELHIFENLEKLNKIYKNYLYLFNNIYKNVIFLNSEHNSQDKLANFIVNKILQIVK